jgi:hypothetical protein
VQYRDPGLILVAVDVQERHFQTMKLLHLEMNLMKVATTILILKYVKEVELVAYL